MLIVILDMGGSVLTAELVLIVRIGWIEENIGMIAMVVVGRTRGMFGSVVRVESGFGNWGCGLNMLDICVQDVLVIWVDFDMIKFQWFVWHGIKLSYGWARVWVVEGRDGYRVLGECVNRLIVMDLDELCLLSWRYCLCEL